MTNDELHAILLQSMRLNGDEIRGDGMHDGGRREGDAEQMVQRYTTARDIKDLQTEIEALRMKVASLEADRSKALLWAMITLGTLVISMAGFIWSIVSKKVLP